MAAIYVLWWREVQRYFRSAEQMLVSLMHPALYLWVLGYGMGPIFAQAGRGNYLHFVAPGVIAMTVLFTATLSGMALLLDRQFGFLKETLVAPVPRVCVLLGSILGTATVALFQGMIMAVMCTIAGFRPDRLSALPAAALVMALTTLLFSSFGTLVGALMKDSNSFDAVMRLTVLPVFFLSGALFPLERLPPALVFLTRLDPLSFGVDGLRSTLISQSHFGLPLDLTVLVSLTVILIGLGAWRFSHIEV